MTSGKYFTETEKKFIIAHADTLSHSNIAEQLGRLYPNENDGSRSTGGVQKFILRERKEGRLE